MKISDITKQIRAFADQLEGTQSALATPPDNRPLHNPDNLTAEQVGVGYRLALRGEPTNLQIEQQEYWRGGAWLWLKSGKVFTHIFDEAQNTRCTYRLPLSVPWPSAPVDPYAELKAAHAAGKVIQILNPQNRYVLSLIHI